jgi:hypothetical protein
MSLPMRFDPQAGLTSDKRPGRSKRRFGRLPQETLMSNIGAVLDLSAGGMRIVCRRLPPARIAITLKGYTLPGPLVAEISWSRRVGLFRQEVGLRFEDVSPEVTQMLTTIAGTHRLRRVM